MPGLLCQKDVGKLKPPHTNKGREQNNMVRISDYLPEKSSYRREEVKAGEINTGYDEGICVLRNDSHYDRIVRRRNDAKMNTGWKGDLTVIRVSPLVDLHLVEKS